MRQTTDFKVIETIDVDTSVKAVKEYLLNLQNRLCHFIECEEGIAKFSTDKWQHQEVGGGITRTLSAGAVIEKAGVNFSHVQGQALPKAATARLPDLAGSHFQALGVSVVVHPLNPYIPTSHFNIRFIVVQKQGKPPFWWFGGGFDLTPYYGFEEDCVHWHQMASAACASLGDDIYPTFKNWADEYFFLKHRNEPRGIGGIFFDDLNDWHFQTCFSFIRDVGEYYIKAYQPIVARRKQHPFTQRERDFQCYRRGRYVEFNLLYDRGTLFGLQSNGRTESILMSLPPLVSWYYDWQPEPHSAEALLYHYFLQKKNWL